MLNAPCPFWLRWITLRISGLLGIAASIYVFWVSADVDIPLVSVGLALLGLAFLLVSIFAAFIQKVPR